ncbi:hypothetical protein Fmac_005353 [Flemingia macrophylla]|uniref:RNase H type-1 domain-containing protein n=1 Tax=Flemingia macrophylla TaxID=520843 RepID=A0ABD1N7H7_9FABA
MLAGQGGNGGSFTFVYIMWDGSALGSLGATGFGGLLRDAQGRWLMGFYGDVSVAEIAKAELLVIWITSDLGQLLS